MNGSLPSTVYLVQDATLDIQFAGSPMLDGCPVPRSFKRTRIRRLSSVGSAAARAGGSSWASSASMSAVMVPTGRYSPIAPGRRGRAGPDRHGDRGRRRDRDIPRSRLDTDHAGALDSFHGGSSDDAKKPAHRRPGSTTTRAIEPPRSSGVRHFPRSTPRPGPETRTSGAGPPPWHAVRRTTRCRGAFAQVIASGHRGFVRPLVR